MIIQLFWRKKFRKHFRKVLNKFFIPILGKFQLLNLIERIFISRSEANDLALRLAREYTGNYDILVLDK